MNPVFSIDMTYPYPPEVVWNALTDSKELGEWLAESNFEPKLGFEFQFHAPPTPNWRGFIECKVVEIDPPKRLAYTWNKDDLQPQQLVTWTLEAAGNGTKLSLVHSGLIDNVGERTYQGFSDGWTQRLQETIRPVLERLNSIMLAD